MKFISESSDATSGILLIELIDIPGGTEAFGLASKFCCSINFEINVENIDMLRCVIEYLEMTVDYSVENLAERTDSYLNDVALKSLEIFGKGRKEIEAHKEQEKRLIFETLVSIMPREKNAIVMSFLSIWLKAAIFLETAVACRPFFKTLMASWMEIGGEVIVVGEVAVGEMVGMEVEGGVM
ncbi:hypothetical protein RYX36_021144 [Vicia faba]